MIGDWVYLFDTPCQVKDIIEDGVINYEKDVTPIHLTEEILKENGFHLCPSYSNVWTANTGGTRFCISNEYKIGHDDIGLFIMITHVHELQHTLKLLNDNREIKLPNR